MPKRYGKTKTANLKAQSRLTENDLAELQKYQQFLKDMSLLTHQDLMSKYWEYMGFNEADCANGTGKK